jgi:hypothetical protein
VTIIENNCLDFVLRLGPWRFHYSEACRSGIMSYVDGKVESEVVKDENFDNFGHVHIQC